MAETSDIVDRVVLEAALGAVGEGVTITDGTGALHYLNDAAAHVLGAGDAAEARSQPAPALQRRCEVFDENGAPFDMAQLPGRRLLAGAPPSEASARVTIRVRSRATDEERWSLVTASLLPPASGRPALALTIFRDVTALKQREREAEQLGLALVAERDTRARFLEQIVGVIGHDLRSPLAAIVMATALLDKVALDERGARALLRVRTSSKRAERLIKDVVDFARVRLGPGIPLQRAEVDLQEVARLTIDELSLAGDRKVTLAVTGDPRGTWDFERMGQVVANLVGNALKHSPSTAVVSVAIEADALEVRLIVHSAGGEPVEPAVLASMFEPFARSGAGGRGDGLGLYLVAAIVHAHGGTVEARSSREAGTTMIARLPR